VPVISFYPNFKFDKDSSIIFLTQDQIKKSKTLVMLDSLNHHIQEVIASGQFSAKEGQLFPIIFQKKVVLLVGLGEKKDLSSTALRIQVRKAFLSPYLNAPQSMVVLPFDEEEANIKALIEGIYIGTYGWRKYQNKMKNEKPAFEKDIVVVAKKKEVYADILTICEGVMLTRNLVNENADEATSEHVEKTIRQLSKNNKKVKIEVLNKKEMESEGLGLHLAVNKASAKEPKLIIVQYQGGSAKDPYTAIVGKGITFDTGGLNLKPTGSMETMRTDMSGSAAVVGILKNTLALEIKKNILFVCAMAENAIGSNAFKPGDVITSYSGKTVEIGNTDAEGRLVLADAFSYIIKNYKPSRIIDMATLTGACVIALGHDYAGLVTTDDDLSRKLIHSSKETDDRIWRLPIYPELKDAVKSQIADIRNLGFPKGAAGTLTAAEFLRQFTEGTPWAHLDIAGTAYVDNGCRLYYGQGATGIGVRLLTHYLMHN
jgi:leucyl aminopeptidase